MPKIFDNMEAQLLPALRSMLGICDHADFAVGYFNLRGWRGIDDLVERLAGGAGACVRVLIGMQSLPQDELRAGLGFAPDEGIDQQQVLRLKKRAAEDFRSQLMVGVPTADDEAGLRRLNAQLRARKVVAKLYLRHKLHAKLYLLYRADPASPIVGYLGSSNLTFAGLRSQGELNIDVLDGDATLKLQAWFNKHWDDKWCLDISDELADIIDSSWAREKPIPPYHIYLKIAYHLSQEARAGLAEFTIPRDLRQQLFDFQTAAVKIAAHHVNKRGGVLIGDVVGLGKTLMATALARIFEEDQGLETLIICPKNLVPMWEDYVYTYHMRAKVLSLGLVPAMLPTLPRYRLVIIDESHNLRNREGKRYKVIHDYIDKNESRCILLTATPYNKTYLDLAAQLRLFVPEDQDLGILPEKAIAAIGEMEFIRRHQCALRSLAAFEKSEAPDDWRDLMRLYMVRRTRSFIQQNYAEVDPATGRQYLRLADGGLSYFPTRRPITVRFTIPERDSADPYARLYADPVVEAINDLRLPRYGLGNYVVAQPQPRPTPVEKAQLDGLGRAGQRLKGFCRTNLFKRLESGGPAFIQSLERHVLRNYVFLHALEHGRELPLGTQDAAMLDTRAYDEDADAALPGGFDDDEEPAVDPAAATHLRTAEEYRQQAAQVYERYAIQYRARFKWLRPGLFTPALAADLRHDVEALLQVLTQCGAWDAARDAKLEALVRLLRQVHPQEKILIFTQFADTVHYLTEQLRARHIGAVAGVTCDSEDPTALARCFSPVSNGGRDRLAPEQELRVLVATDVLSEGQNLQDAAIVVNYDLPWAIIRLIQRAGRVDRIGQQADTIRCYSFLPADGVERIIRLRQRVRQRLRQNAEVVGTDEAFFEDDMNEQAILDIYNEKAGILDGDADTEVDLASYAYQIWKNAIDANPSLKTTIENMPNVVYATRSYVGTPREPQGVLLYMRTGDGNDALAWVDRDGQNVTQSQLAILRAAECPPDTPALPRDPRQHELVAAGARLIAEETKTLGGQLGRPSGARFKTYERLKQYVTTLGPLFALHIQAINKVLDDIYRFPLQQAAADTLNRQLRAGIDDETLARLVLALRDDDRLCRVHDEDTPQEPQIICSLGLFYPGEDH